MNMYIKFTEMRIVWRCLHIVWKHNGTKPQQSPSSDHGQKINVKPAVGCPKHFEYCLYSGVSLGTTRYVCGTEHVYM